MGEDKMIRLTGWAPTWPPHFLLHWSAAPVTSLVVTPDLYCEEEAKDRLLMLTNLMLQTQPQPKPVPEANARTHRTANSNKLNVCLCRLLGMTQLYNFQLICGYTFTIVPRAS